MNLRKTKEFEVCSWAGIKFAEIDTLIEACTRTQDCTRLAVGVVRNDHKVTGCVERTMAMSNSPDELLGERRCDGLSQRSKTTWNAFADSGKDLQTAILHKRCKDRKPDTGLSTSGTQERLEDVQGTLGTSGTESLGDRNVGKAVSGVGVIGRLLAGEQIEAEEHDREQDREHCE